MCDQTDEQEIEIALKLFLVTMRATHALKERALNHIQSSNLCLTDFLILESLLHKGKMPTCAVASKIPITTGSMTAAVDRLEAKGLIERTHHDTDRRTRLIDLTEKGRELIVPFFADHAAIIRSATGGLNDDEKLEFIRLAKKLGKFAEAIE